MRRARRSPGVAASPDHGRFLVRGAVLGSGRRTLLRPRTRRIPHGSAVVSQRASAGRSSPSPPAESGGEGRRGANNPSKSLRWPWGTAACLCAPCCAGPGCPPSSRHQRGTAVVAAPGWEERLPVSVRPDGPDPSVPGSGPRRGDRSQRAPRGTPRVREQHDQKPAARTPRPGVLSPRREFWWARGASMGPDGCRYPATAATPAVSSSGSGGRTRCHVTEAGSSP